MIMWRFKVPCKFESKCMRSVHLKKLILWGLATIWWAAPAMAELTVASLFTDHMVLQRDQALPVWGWSDPGAEITVAFAGQEKQTTADAAGKWMLELDATSASYESRDLEISSELESEIQNLQYEDVVVGEVWICSGQSNMQYSVHSVPETKALTAEAKNLRTFNVKRTVAFTEQDRCEGEWVVNYPDSSVAFGFAYFLQQSADVPVGIILTCWGSSSIEAWMPRDMTETVPHFKTMMEEFDANTTTRDKITTILEEPKPWSRQDDVFLRRQSNILYNAMMHPLAPYACRGLVWYQGERNTQSMFGMLKTPWYSRNSGMLKYGDTLTQWIQRYREEWNHEQMQFLITMLPGYGAVMDTGSSVANDHPAAHSWAWMRESQLKALALPHTGVANTIDLGDIKQLHPKDKLPVGKRLALLAARDTLEQQIEAQGPIMNHVDVGEGRLIVHFDHAEGLKTSDGKEPTGFWMADDTGEWVKADAKLEGQTVVLYSSELSQPLYVRYAFSGMPSVNLINASGLPAYPFRSDNFAP
jgi:sialate O-acetylesterase